MSYDSFFSNLLIQFPKIALDFELEDGDHYNMERFASYTIEQIEQKNIKELNRCFNFIDSRLDTVKPEIENALNVSYCEALLFHDGHKNGIKLEKVMPKNLLRFYLDYKKYYDSLG